MVTSFQVVFDSADPDRLMRFWSGALHYPVPEPPEGAASWEAWLTEHGVPEETWNDARALEDPEGRGPRLFFQRVPEPKAVKNRLHLDVDVGGRPARPVDQRRPLVDAEADRLAGLGATRLDVQDKGDEYWVVMQDPEGNEFCLV
jgi:hypothetical protein